MKITNWILFAAFAVMTLLNAINQGRLDSALIDNRVLGGLYQGVLEGRACIKPEAIQPPRESSAILEPAITQVFRI